MHALSDSKGYITARYGQYDKAKDDCHYRSNGYWQE